MTDFICACEGDDETTPRKDGESSFERFVIEVEFDADNVFLKRVENRPVHFKLDGPSTEEDKLAEQVHNL